MTSRDRQRPPADRRAFTLVEMVVAVGIVVILVALTVSASVVVVRRSEVRETQNTLRLLETALLEWEQTVDRKLTWGEEDVPYEQARYEILYDDRWPHASLAGVEYDRSMTSMLLILERLEKTRDVLAQIDTDYLERRDDPNERLQVLDSWGGVIVMVHPGRIYDNITFTEAGVPDPDGTIRVGQGWNPEFTRREQILGVCRSRQVCFVSAGPDGEFGDLHLDVAETSLTPAQREDVRQADDNIYSYELSRERPGP